jgi:hypothetical protein
MDWSDRIGRRIKLRDLHILMAVADAGSMAKAAARLRISHPAVSKAISEIEGALGVRLFDRGSKLIPRGPVAAGIWLFALTPVQTTTLIVAYALLVQGYRATVAS